MTWTIAKADSHGHAVEKCGACWQTIPSGEPVALFMPGSQYGPPISAPKKRCAPCALKAGFVVDWAAIERLQEAQQAAVDAPLTVSQYAARVEPQRRSNPRSLKPVEPYQAGQLFDPKAAAAGDRD